MQTGGTEVPGVQEAAGDTVNAPEQGVAANDGIEDLTALSTREITELSLAQAREENDKAGSQGSEAQAPKPSEVRGQTQTLKQPAAEGEAPVVPPNRLTDAEKQAFNALPPNLKAATARMFRDQERHFRARTDELARATRGAADFTANVDKYLMARPHLVQQGYTSPSFVNALLGFHMQLEDPKTRDHKWALIARDIEMNEQRFMQVGRALGFGHLFGQQAADNGGVIDITSHPGFQQLQGQISSLHENLNPVMSFVEQQRHDAFEREKASKLQEGEAVQGEKDVSGRLRYPELHDSAFLQQANSLVVELGTTLPGVSFSDRLRIAVHELGRGLTRMEAIAAAARDKTGNSTQAAGPTRLPGNQTNTLERATRAAVTVRGRSLPSAGEVSGTDLIAPPEVLQQGTRAVTEWTLNAMRARGGH